MDGWMDGRTPLAPSSVRLFAAWGAGWSKATTASTFVPNLMTQE